MKIKFENIEDLFPNTIVQRNLKLYDTAFELIYLPDHKLYIHLVKISIALQKLESDFFQKMSIYFLNKGLNLIHLFEDQLKNNLELIKYRFSSLLDNNKRIHARACKIERIDKKVYDLFVAENHLMDTANSRYKYGIFLKSELMGVMGISAGRWMTQEGHRRKSFEIIRFATKLNFTIVGGFTKFLKHIKNELNLDEYMSYQDLDWAIHSVYHKNDFKLKEYTKPLKYFIHKKTWKRYSEKQVQALNDFNTSEYIITFNSGNIKFIRQYD